MKRFIRPQLIGAFFLFIGTCGVLGDREPGEKLWETGFDAMFESADYSVPAVGADGAIYVTLDVNREEKALLALNADGTERWRVPGVSGTPVLGLDGAIYARHEGFSAFNPDGSLKWSFSIPGNPRPSPAAVGADGTIYFGVESGLGFPGGLNDDHFYALNPDGTEKWNLHVGVGMSSQPAVARDGTVYFLTLQAFRSDNKLYAVRSDGTIQWTFPVKEGFQESPTVGEDGTIFFVNGSHLVAVSPDGLEKWTFPIGSVHSVSPIIGMDGAVYVGSHETFWVVNPDGTLKWELALGERVTWSAALGADGTIYFGSEEQFYALHPDGRERWRFPTGLGSSPTLTPEGVIYAVNSSRNLVALQGDAPLARTPWPMSGRNLQNTARAEGGVTLQITEHPQSRNLPEGEGATLRVVAASSEPLRYQWRHNGEEIEGATSPEYTIRFARPSDSGAYRVAIHAEEAWTVSSSARLTVLPGASFTERRLPTGFFLGQPFEVVLIAEPPPEVLVYAVEDEPPAGWGVGAVSHGGQYDSGTGKVKYGPFHDSVPRQLTYELTPPAGGEAVINRFEGYSSAEGVVAPITGDDAIGFEAALHPADMNPTDNAISLDEVTAYGWAWSTEASWPAAPSPIPRAYVERAAALWQGGERYVFDSARSEEAQRWINPELAEGAQSMAQSSLEPRNLSSRALALLGDDSGPQAGEILWSVDVETLPQSPAVGPDGVIYVGTGDIMLGQRVLYAFNPDGALRWRAGEEGIPFGNWMTYPVFSAPSIAPDGTIYVGRGSPAHLLQAYDPDGNKLWEFSASISPDHAPVLAEDGTIYFGSSWGSSFYALHPNGTEKWKLPLGPVRSAAVGRDGTVYLAESSEITGRAPTLYAVSPEGEVQWNYAMTSGFVTSPAIGEDGAIYFGAGHALHAVHPDGTARWVFDIEEQVSIWGAPAIGLDGTIYFGDFQGTLYAVNPEGTAKWKFDAGSVIASTPALAEDGTIFFGTHASHHALNPDGSEKWRWNLSGNSAHSPALSADGMLYFVSPGANKLIAVNAGSPLARSPWPMHGHDPRHSGRAGSGRTFARFVTHPLDQTVPAGISVSFGVEALANEPLSFQWRHNGRDIPGATEPTYSIPVASAAHAGEYHAAIFNDHGFAVSAGAVLTVEGALPFVARHFPSGFYPDETFEVVLVAEPFSHFQVYAFEDEPPAAWTVVSVSEGGVYDSRTGKVKFGPFFDHEPREMRYELRAPAGGVAGFNRFAGAASGDGVGSPILGNAAVDLESVFHPADINPPDNTIKMEEASDYAAAWRAGQTWPVAPNPIPISYVTRAATLWLGGEHYVYDADIAGDALRWLNPIQPQRLALQSSTTQSGFAPAGSPAPGAALRTVSGSSREVVSVSVAVTPAAGTLSYAVEDDVPAGWTFSEANHGGVLDSVNRRVKWGPFHDDQPRAFSYALVPSGAPAEAELAGTASFDGLNIVVEGQTLFRPRLPPAGGWSDTGAFQLFLDLNPGARHRIDVSADLRTWVEWITLDQGTGTVLLEDAGAGERERGFYRIVPLD